jgi:hypothetical protein
MNVNNINPFQGQQNAFRSDGGNASVSRGGEPELTIVQDPPLLPIATYQRLDNIKPVRSVEAEVERSASHQKLPDAPSADIAKSNEADAPRAVTSEKIQLGTILSVKA